MFTEKLKKLRTNEFLSLNERIEFADIKQAEVGLEITSYICLLTGIEIEVDNAELVGPLCHQGEETRREDMDAGEGKVSLTPLHHTMRWFHFPRLNIYPPIEPHLLIEDEIAGCVSTTNQQCCVVICGNVVKLGKIDIMQYIHIMDEDR